LTAKNNNKSRNFSCNYLSFFPLISAIISLKRFRSFIILNGYKAVILHHNNMKKIKKIAVMTSGGDAPGMNAAIRAVVRSCAYYSLSCVGIYRGYEGLIEDDLVDLNARSVHNIINKGGTVLKSARSKEFRTKEGRQKAYENLVEREVDALVVIGGDGSFTGAVLFNEEFGFPVIGIPGTIDNDIFGTSHTLGYDTALNTAVEAIDKIRDTASSHNRLFFVEVMGRDAGFIALNAGVGAGAEEILIPEEDLGLDRMLESLEKSRRAGKSSSIVVVAEGDKSGKNVYELAKYVEENLPEYDVRVSILGHMQRGGSPSCFDRVLASRLGVKAVELLLDGKTNLMVGLKDNLVISTDIKEAISGGHSINYELLRVSDIITT
jgi:6-phosphofructokinase 1